MEEGTELEIQSEETLRDQQMHSFTLKYQDRFQASEQNSVHSETTPNRQNQCRDNTMPLKVAAKELQ